VAADEKQLFVAQDHVGFGQLHAPGTVDFTSQPSNARPASAFLDE
jgi:hypothetical protein